MIQQYWGEVLNLAERQKIQSISQFIEEINSIEIKSEMRMFPPKLLFRGQSRTNFELVPSLGRYPSQHWLNSWASVEKDLVQSAQQKFPLLFPDTDYPVILLAKLQHYGIYTRMLDLTENALTALYFSCNKDDDCDGEVLAFQASVCSAYDPTANIVADTYRLTSNAITSVENYYFRAMNRPYSSRLLYSTWKDDMRRGIEHLTESTQRPIFLEVGTVCERQKNQGGCFAIFPSKIYEGEVIANDLIKLSKDDTSVVKRLIIDKNSKVTIVEQLKRFGITKEFLFADDVDIVLKGIIDDQRKRYPES